MEIKRLIFIFWGILSSIGVYSQELDCTVSVNFSQISSKQIPDPAVFEEMKSAITTFMNTQRWTNDIFGPNEKIKCNLTLNLLQSPRLNVFSGNVQFQVIRPVYGTTYQTLLIQYLDRNVDFSFAPEERLMVFNEQSFTNNLTSILAFYSLVALALDYDSFGKLGGTPYIQRAFNVVNLANDASVAWQARSDTRSRYWLMENLQNQQLLTFREGLYMYHRLALDDFSGDIIGHQQQIIAWLKELLAVQEKRGNLILLSSFLDAKTEELTSLFGEASPTIKQEAFQVLTKLAPDKTSAFRNILKPN